MTPTQIPERRTDRSLRTLLQDETGAWSAARCFLAAWLLNAIVYVWWASLRSGGPPPEFGLVLTFCTGVALPLVVWAAGPRIAQYLGPMIGATTAAVADAAKALAAKIQARRDPAAGYEVSK